MVGLLGMKDFNIYFPSMLGLLSALAQLFLKGIYGGGGNANAETGLLQEMSKKVQIFLCQKEVKIVMISSITGGVLQILCKWYLKKHPEFLGNIEHEAAPSKRVL